MTIRIAVSARRGSFSDRWIESSLARDFEVLVVDGFSSDIVSKLRGSDALLWHLNHNTWADLAFARSILKAVERMGLVVFPNMVTAESFDDKVAQKYLLEASEAPLAPTWIFHRKAEALEWIETAEFPLVFKLGRGAGSSNVRLVETRHQARRITRMMFASGKRCAYGLPPALGGRPSPASFVPRDRVPGRVLTHLRTKVQGILRPRREQGYVLFQKFIAGNDRDTRVTVIGNRAFTFVRRVRPDDFRASGSGLIEYPGADAVDLKCVEEAFRISQHLGFQSMAYDFVTEPGSGRRLLLEISYVFNAKAVYDCPGYFDSDMGWNAGHAWPQDAILEDVVEVIENSKRLKI